MSVILRPSLPPAEVSRLTLLCAVAVAEAELRWNFTTRWSVVGFGGAGKTSLMRAIAGRLKLDSGSVTVGGAGGNDSPGLCHYECMASKFCLSDITDLVDFCINGRRDVDHRPFYRVPADDPHCPCQSC